MKYHVVYIENGYDRVKSFASKQAAEKFINKFSDLASDDRWIYFVFYGKMLKTFVQIRGTKV